VKITSEVPKKKDKPKTLKIPVLLSLFLSIGIIIVILYFTFDVQTLNYLRSSNIRYEFFLAALGVNFVYLFIWALRQKILADSLDTSIKLPVWESTKIIFANLFLANITPSMAGGEPVRIHLLQKNGLSLGASTAAVFSGRLLDAIFLLISVPFSMWVYRQTVGIESIQIGLTIAIILFLIAVGLLIYAIKNHEKTKAFLIWVNLKINKLFKRKKDTHYMIASINKEVDAFHDGMVFFVTKGKLSFLFAFGLTVLFWGVGWIIPFFILLGLGQPPQLFHVIAAQILLIIIVMMPTTPGSAGITEGGMAALYSVFVTTTSIIGIFIVLYRLITYYSGLILGAIFQYRIFKSVVSFSLEAIAKEDE